ncbi:recombinase family protein [Mycetocola spongiae]|uniref:recombinase family protein n=1 Tax=Mycetocola spongiae TaxID=2859226 RepID=UPI001CF3615A|nr:recombinase family protein [Mycetocola spongiae]UCR88077.1 recombinase family protein [Mycetocola spongiae]
MSTIHRIGYTRVSTVKQELGLEAQQQQLIGYGVAKENIFVDRGVSGTTNAHSKKMNQLMAAVRAHEGKVEVVMAKLDRWGREPEETIALLKQLEPISGCLTSLADGVSMVTPKHSVGMLIIRVMLAVAAQERDRIAERTREGLAAEAARGTPLGPPPKLTSKDVAWIREKHEKDRWGSQRIMKALPEERNVTVSRYTVQVVLGQVKRAKPYVPKDNHKYVKRGEAAALKVAAKSKSP